MTDPALLELFRHDVTECGGRIEDNLAALTGGGEVAPLPKFAEVASDARTIAGGARLLGLEPAVRLALALADAAGAGARGGARLRAAAVDALCTATALLRRIAAASSHLSGWMAQHADEVAAALSAVAATCGVPPRPPEPPRTPRFRAADTAAPEAGSSAAPDAFPKRSALGTRRGIIVLLVDDQRMIAEAIRQMLRGEAGLVLHHCADPRHALAMAAEVKPTVILQDLVMPDVDGLTLIRYFRAYPATSDVPIIALSTLQEPALKAAAFQSGANDYVVKLPDRLELVARIRYLSKGYLHLLDSQEAWAAVLASQEQLEIRNRFIRQTFGRYLSDEIVDSLLETPGGLDLGGETRRVTIMMTDLRGFTQLCETLPPRQIVTMLNNYLAAMTDVVVRYAGTIDEFIGDAMLVVFGAPIRHDDDARRAIACAVEMQQTMDQVNAQNAELGLPRLEMGIGLSTGEVVIGNIGSYRRAKYGVVGTHVILASRVESYTIGGQILATESTLQDAGDGVCITGQMEIVAKGVTAAMTVYEVGGIGAPYDRHLALRKDEPLVPLAAPVGLRYLVLRDKRSSGEWQHGDLVALSSRMGRIRVARPLAAMEYVKIEIRAEGLLGIDLWGKTVASRDGAPDASFDVWFMSIPEQVRVKIAASATSRTG